MIKKLKILFWSILLLAIMGGTVYVVYLYRTTPTSLYPYPYYWEKASFAVDAAVAPEESSSSSDSSVVILGDRMGKALGHYATELVEQISQGLSTPIRIEVQAEYNEGLHRSLHRLKQLPFRPKVIIYHGASEETFEKKFNLEDAPEISFNIERFNDPYYQTLLMQFPVLSKILYKRIQRVGLDKLTRIPSDYTDMEYLQLLEISYKLFEIELTELVHWTREQHIQLIFVTTPLNLEVLPKAVCSSATSEEIVAMQNHIFPMIQSGDYKLALSQLIDIQKLTPSNALTQFMLGQAYRGLGQITQGIEHLQMATAFDCRPWRSNTIFNIILRKLASRHDIFVADFEQIVNEQMGQNILFLDEIFPQHIFYQQLDQVISQQIKKYLQLTP